MELFGTDGIRNRVGLSPFTLKDLSPLSHAIAQWLLHKNQKKIVIGTDSRLSGDWIKTTLISTLLAHDISVDDAGIITTPGLHTLTALQNQDLYCIMISASHNPHEDNGIKIMGRHGKINNDDEEYITQQFIDKNASYSPTFHSFGTTTPLASTRDYHGFITAHFNASFLQGHTIVLDCAHGATSYHAPHIFKTLGAHVITLNATPNGTNINDNCGALYPNTLQKAVTEHNALCGFAFDGDGDRVIAVNINGEVKMGDDILALLSHHPLYESQSTIVTTVMTNYGFTNYLTHYKKNVIQTAVGDKHVLSALDIHCLLLGGEQSGHIILRDFSPIGDGIVTALRLLEAMMYTKNMNMKTFTRYPQILINLPVTEKKDLDADPLQSIIESHNQQLHEGRLLIRYSGTEKLLRVMVEDTDTNHAEMISSSLVNALSKHLITHQD